jgi:hypothetical protein
MPMDAEYHLTPLVCENGHSYEDEVEWKIHYVAQVDQPTNQVPEIRTTCRECDAALKVAEGWTPYPPAR